MDKDVALLLPPVEDSGEPPSAPPADEVIPPMLSPEDDVAAPWRLVEHDLVAAPLSHPEISNFKM
jgi:hypothetical protein